MNEDEFEGTLVLEKLARIDKIDEFFAAIDSDDFNKAVALLKSAGIDEETSKTVVKKMHDPCDEH